MTGQTRDDPVIQRFREVLSKVYGDRVERAVLYGSRARGDARQDSDYDVAVFFRDDFDFGRELFKLADIGTALLGETGSLVSALPFRSEDEAQRWPLMHEIRADGIEL
jgi:predicted nucleotidyltransferase